MSSLLRRVFSETRADLSALRSLGLRIVLVLTAVQAVTVGVLVAMAEVRKRRRGPSDGFPWEDQPEIGLESSEDRLKIYAYGVRLYEDMIQEIERAEREIFVGTFIWKDDEVGHHFVDTLARRAREGVRVYAFFDFWNSHRTGDLPEIVPNKERDWNPAVRVRSNDPYMRIFPIRGMYLEAIDRANSHVYLTHAYFVPDRALKAHLIEAARRGVDVQMLVPEQSNHVTADWLARRHFHELLEAGVRIFRYKHIMIHSKTATVDGHWSTIGSANIDRYSMLGNYELNIEVYSRSLAAQMERMFEVDKTNAEELTLVEWENRPLPAKIVEQTLANLSPLV